MLADLAWLWLVIPVATGLLLVWVAVLELQHVFVFRLFLGLMKGRLK